ncbi:tyrosine-type recombinase/integrase [Achromobacter denitrificans]|uniref:Tyrosine-type recombinase/integrase n=1 Tax=Achromobacter denitrificans TaxID=32002 RepID=A0ABZ3G5H2_ACHDE
MAHLRLHDLRHSAASEMINAKVDLHTVGAGLGHKSAASTKRYAHLATDAIKTALGLGQIGKKSPTQKKTRVA